MPEKNSKFLNVNAVTNNRLSPWFYLVWGLLAASQFVLLTRFELFGDEAFYWLEGQHLAWSYAELPGFTAWQAALSEWLFPHSPLSLRLLPWLASLSLPVLCFAMARQVVGSNRNNQYAAWLVLSLPLMAVVSVLALPDIWLLLFGLLAVYLLLRTMQHGRTGDFVWLGIVVALGINVHLRFWLIAALLAILAILEFRKKPNFSQLLSISLPLALLGLLPILWFNWQHDFPLLNFQLKERHPWSFQAQHSLFIPLQWLISSPPVFMLWLYLGYLLYKQRPTLSAAQRLIFWLSIIHWLIYVLVGFFSDNLRLNVHWPLFSYLLLFTAIGSITAKRLTVFAIASGVSLQFLLIGWLLYWQQQDPPSQLAQRIISNADGWEELAKKTAELLQKHQYPQVISDHFMTAAELAYYLPETEIKHIVKSLPHPLNHKHGRALQLKLMDRAAVLNEQSQALLVVEQTALKLNQQIDYYLDLCQQSKGLQWLDSLSTRSGSKVYHFFATDNEAICQLPTITYAERSGTQIKGWVLVPKGQLAGLQLVQNGQLSKLEYDPEGQAPKGNPMFDRLPNEQYRLYQFSGEGKARPFRISVKRQGHQATAGRLFF